MQNGKQTLKQRSSQNDVLGSRLSIVISRFFYLSTNSVLRKESCIVMKGTGNHCQNCRFARTIFAYNSRNWIFKRNFYGRNTANTTICNL